MQLALEGGPEAVKQCLKGKKRGKAANELHTQ